MYSSSTHYRLMGEALDRLLEKHKEKRKKEKQMSDKVEIKVEGQSKWISRESAIELGLVKDNTIFRASCDDLVVVTGVVGLGLRFKTQNSTSDGQTYVVRDSCIELANAILKHYGEK